MANEAACEACGRPDCPTPMTIDGRDTNLRNCEYPGCHEQLNMSAMYRLWREEWYCAEHARDQLQTAAADEIGPDERAVARHLGLDLGEDEVR